MPNAAKWGINEDISIIGCIIKQRIKGFNENGYITFKFQNSRLVGFEDKITTDERKDLSNKDKEELLTTGL